MIAPACIPGTLISKRGTLATLVKCPLLMIKWLQTAARNINANTIVSLPIVPASTAV